MRFFFWFCCVLRHYAEIISSDEYMVKWSLILTKKSKKLRVKFDHNFFYSAELIGLLVFFSAPTEPSDYLLVLVCLLTIAVHQVFARPLNSQDYHLNMSMEPNEQSLEDALRSPCREANLPREDQSSANIKGVLQIIGRQSAIAKSIAKEDVEKYVSKKHRINW